MTNWKDGTQNMVYNGRIKVPYLWNVGAIGSRFLKGLRDKKEIWGVRCPQCQKVYVPPVKTCGECFVPTQEWIQVQDTGTLESYTIVRYASDAQPSSTTPLAFGLIKLDGADGALLHLLGGLNLDKLSLRMRVKAVFADQRTGSIMDIKYFAPA